MNRRDFLVGTAGTALALAALGASAQAEPKREPKPMLKKGILFSMLPESLSIADKFKLARDIGMQGVEAHVTSDAAEIKSMRDGAEKTGVAIHSVMYGGWQAPLSSADPKVAEQGVKEVANALKCAKELGANGVLLVPGMVNADTRYLDAYTRSQAHLKELVPTAEKLGVQILIENVWNNFLLSPIEFARYIDEIKSPMVQAYFDVGNVLAFGWPEDWIRTLGSRIKKVHIKDFKRGPRQFCDLLDGDVNWPEVRKALGEVGYSGYLTCELMGGDEAYLREVSARMDRIVGLTTAP